MPIQRSITDIVADIAGTCLPSLFVDTCAAFDIVRCAWRARPRVAAIAKQVIEAHVAGELLLFGPSVLQKEAARNRVEVESEARKKALEVDGSMTSYQHIAHILGDNYPHTAAYSHESLVPRLIGLHDQLLTTCVHVLPDLNLVQTAFARASDNRRPARKGGGANDCLLFEEFRRVAHAAPVAGPLILLTTNPDDFADKSAAGGIHQDITGDLAGTKAIVCLTWDWAAGLVLNQARLKSI